MRAPCLGHGPIYAEPGLWEDCLPAVGWRILHCASVSRPVPAVPSATAASTIQGGGWSDFRDHATKYLAGHQPLAVERHGKVIGLYFPVRADKDEARRALDRIESTVDELLARTGMTEQEFADALETESRG